MISESKYMVKNLKMLNPHRSKCLNRPDIEMGDEDGGSDDETDNSGPGFFIKYDSNCEFTQLERRMKFFCFSVIKCPRKIGKEK
jgi:hypothetical protein